MNAQSQEFTLRGYLELLRRQAWLILLVGAICALGALAISLLHKPTYAATAALAANSPSQELAALGGSYPSTQTPLQLASTAARQADRPAVVAGVERRLGASLASGKLGTVAIAIDPDSYAVEITDTNASAARAAAVANAFANVDVALTTASTRAQYAAQAAAIHARLTLMPRGSPEAATTAQSYARLQSLSAVATPLSISSTATVPVSPSSPKTLRDTFAALLFGLLLGLLLGTARDALDRRLRHAPDVIAVLNRPIVGYIRAEALGHSGVEDGAEGGARDGGGALEPADREAFRILRQNALYMGVGEGRRTLLVTSAMVEEGKSTVAACLAATTAGAGMRTLLIECDLRRPVLAQRLGLNPAPGLADYLSGHAQVREIEQQVAEAGELICITSGTTVADPAELLGSERSHGFIREAGENFDAVILDTPPLLPVADALAIAAEASALLVCIRLERTTREQAQAVQAALASMPQRPVGLVLTGVRRAEDGSYYGDYSREATPALASA